MAQLWKLMNLLLHSCSFVPTFLHKEMFAYTYKTLEKGLLSTNAETINTCPFTKRMSLHLQVCLGIWKKPINLELAYERASSKTAATHDGIDNLKQSVQPNKENAQK